MQNIASGFSSGFEDLMMPRGDRGSHPNPMFKYLQGFAPKSIKEAFTWAEFLYAKSPHIYSAIQKLSDYAITEINYLTDSNKEEKRHYELLEKTLNVKSILKASGMDKRIYGNSFVSIYLPFTRYLKCNHCKALTNINVVNYKFKYKSMSFHWTCQRCKNQAFSNIDQVVDREVRDAKKINIIRWDPKRINIDYNSLTGEAEYSYSIPAVERKHLQKGLKSLLNTTPKGFLKAAKENRVFKFKPGKVFHTKTQAPAGVNSAWGVSPLLVTMDRFLFVSMLKKANEAIASEYLTPFRVLHPAQAVGSIDPATSINLAKWQDETKQNIKRWRRDPLHIQMAPIPLGVTQMGGQGRSLLTSQEIEAEENTILASQGVPREFLYGGLSFTGSSVTLRMLENQLLNDTSDLRSLLQWIGDSCANFLHWEKVEYDLVPFKLIDDVQQKSLLISLNQQEQVLSKTTLSNLFGYELEKERQLQEKEVLEDTRNRIKLDRKIEELQNSLVEQAHAQAQPQNLNYNQHEVMAQADAIVEDFLQAPSNVRRSQLESLKREDFVMYSVVVQRLSDYSRMQNQRGAAEEQMQ